jgi:hypothetical protein
LYFGRVAAPYLYAVAGATIAVAVHYVISTML